MSSLLTYLSLTAASCSMLAAAGSLGVFEHLLLKNQRTPYILKYEAATQAFDAARGKEARRERHRELYKILQEHPGHVDRYQALQSRAHALNSAAFFMAGITLGTAIMVFGLTLPAPARNTLDEQITHEQ